MKLIQQPLFKIYRWSIFGMNEIGNGDPYYKADKVDREISKLVLEIDTLESKIAACLATLDNYKRMLDNPNLILNDQPKPNHKTSQHDG